MSAEAKGVAHGVVDLGWYGFAGDDVEFADPFRFNCFCIDGGWDDVVAQGDDADDGFYGTGCAQQVARHGFGGADGWPGTFAKYPCDGFEFAGIAHGGRGGVGV